MDSPRLPPTRVAPETFVVHHHRDDVDGLLPINVMVIRGAEPVLVDTGGLAEGDGLLADVFALVEPADLRWVFVSHDDADHVGNLAAVVDVAPHAVVVVDEGICRRLGAALPVPAHRRLVVADGERFDAGDRRLVAVRPPVFDAPTTRGLYDPTTGVYWSADAFATTVGAPVAEVGALDPAAWVAAMTATQHRVAPWLAMVDDRRFQACVDGLEGLGIGVLTGAHTPVIRRAQVDAALAALRDAPARGPIGG